MILWLQSHMLVEWFEVENNIYACLEIGCAEVRIMVCNIRDERLYVLSQQTVKAEGIENGNITNVNQVVQKLKALKEQVEADLKQPVLQVLLSIPTVDISIENVVSTMDLDSYRPIESANIKQLLRDVMNQPVDEDQVSVSVVPRNFRIDNQNAVQNPQGILGKRLSLEAQKIIAPAMLVYNLINVVELSGFRIADIILGSVAEALYLPNFHHLRRGVCHVNIGKGLTTITVLHSGRIDSTKALSLGGQDVTCDICEAFKVDEETAEMLKLNFGQVNLQEHLQEVIYINEVEGELVLITRQMLNDVISSRYEKIFRTIRQHLNEHAYKSDEIQYILTGGSSEARGAVILAKEVLGQNVMVYRPSMLGVRHAKYVKLVGMAIFAHELALVTEQKSNIIDISQYEEIQDKLKESSTEKLEPELEDQVQEQSLKDHELESSGVLGRLFDRIFEEKSK